MTRRVESVHGNQIIALEQNYGGFTYIFDIGGSYESVVEVYGGRVDHVGKDGPRINPFAPAISNSYTCSSSCCSRMAARSLNRKTTM